MPELDVIPMRMCVSNERFEARVTGTTGMKYLVTFGPLYGRELERQGCEYGWTCACAGFKFRGTCAHVQAAERLRCGWHEQWGGDGPEVVSLPNVEILYDARSADSDIKDESCPMCGGAIRIVRCAV